MVTPRKGRIFKITNPRLGSLSLLAGFAGSSQNFSRKSHKCRLRLCLLLHANYRSAAITVYIMCTMQQNPPHLILRNAMRNLVHSLSVF